MRLADQSLRGFLSDLEPNTFNGRVWRVLWRELDPVDWSLSLRTTGRYHRGLDLYANNEAWPALYTSSEPHIAVWEMVRRSAARNLLYLANNVLSEIEVSLGRVFDLTIAPTMQQIQDRLTQPDFQICHQIAQFARQQGADGIVVPSAALTGENIVILPENLQEPLPLNVLASSAMPIDLSQLE